ncbi:hypothetical protein BKA67DRAFT_652494 [Truncatella angustata]|uniref:BZIP domain-containing protein n=1 Tax=Truncatella angustata TaxID=152316 RepID=A0A9P9A191_9PEZI|nr:uncharacterized protein BKA67DRAFT_652494 [Truncatella angustata]KAH6659251.1 hypothetical protein BKA67DRAFT_652494 [Truncatella angustata]KAH8201100.1 hypothetical protein TruAng_004727 [Truncatella angustata]
MSGNINHNFDPASFSSAHQNDISPDFDLGIAPEDHATGAGGPSDEELFQLILNSEDHPGDPCDSSNMEHFQFILDPEDHAAGGGGSLDHYHFQLTSSPKNPSPAYEDDVPMASIERPSEGDFLQVSGYVGAPSREYPDDVSTTKPEPAPIATLRNTNSFLSEAELAAQKAYINSYGLSQTADMANLAAQITKDLDQRQLDRLTTFDSAEQVQSAQKSAPGYENDTISHDLPSPAEQTNTADQYQCPPNFPLSQYPSPSGQSAGAWYANSAYRAVEQALGNNASPAPERNPALSADSLDRLIARAQRAATIQATTPAPSRETRRTAKRKAQTKPKGKKSHPTPMQCAPLSVSAEPDVKRVKIDVEEDGTPHVILREGEDLSQPVMLAECVARPRDEQLTRPRDGEAPVERVRINSRRSRPPYLPLEDNMTQEERLRRAMRNQEISELDRQDRRSRNNESARRTRERTRKTIADQAATIEAQNSRIQELQDQVAAQQMEMQFLRASESRRTAC